MVELKHKKMTYYIEEEVSINRLGEVAITRFYLKRRATLFGIKLPFWRYVTRRLWGGGDYINIKQIFYTIEEAKKYFDDNICAPVTKAHKKTRVIETLKC